MVSLGVVGRLSRGVCGGGVSIVRCACCGEGVRGVSGYEAVVRGRCSGGEAVVKVLCCAGETVERGTCCGGEVIERRPCCVKDAKGDRAVVTRLL